MKADPEKPINRVGKKIIYITMKKKKLTLTELQVKSFVTVNDPKIEQTIKGGAKSDPTALTLCFICPDPTAQTNCFVCGSAPVRICPVDQ